MGSENRIQKLNRELRELALNARREREEFEEFALRSGRRRYMRALGSDGQNRDQGRGAED